MKKIKNRLIAILLAVIMTVSGVGVNTVYAYDSNVANALSDWTLLDADAEAAVEAFEDEKSTCPAGSWAEARADGLAMNAFHNSVQEHIRRRYKGTVKEKEERMYYGKDNDAELQGKWGRADIVIEKNNINYIYEIKPMSYKKENYKNIRARKQLENYVNTSKDSNVKGGGGVTGGTACIALKSTESADIYILYLIKYTMGIGADEGLIFYEFTRHEVGREQAAEQAEAKVLEEALESKARKNAIEEIGILIYTFDTEEVVVLIDVPMLEDLVKMTKLALVLMRQHSKIMANPDTANSVSAEMVTLCKEFLSQVMPCILAGSLSEKLPQLVEAYDCFLTGLDALEADDLINEAIESLNREDPDQISEIIKSIRALSSKYYEACNAQPPIDPLVIDLGVAGIELHSMENGVYFDLDNNGFAERTAWIGTEDGFLALDRDGNGKIENGGELFGDQTLLANGEQSTSGFEVLAELDDNSDGKIDSNDEIFDRLLVWTDVNHNGVSEPGELKSLTSLGIKSISLEHEKTSFIDEETGARIAETAEVEIETGTDAAKTSISEFWFPVNAGDTTHGGTVTAGNIPEINQAVANDKTGELKNLFYMFCESRDIAYKRYYTRQILYFISGANDIDSESRGGNIDAKELKVVEQFMGRKFEGVGGENPNVNAAVVLKELYNDIEEYYYTVLNMYAGLGGYLTGTYEYVNDGETVVDFSLVYYGFDQKIKLGEDIDYLVYDLGLYIKIYDESHGTNYYDEYDAHYSAISSHYADVVDMTRASTLYVGDTKNENYIGNNGSDIIFSEDGDDNINTGAGNDILTGGKGNDTLNGGIGNDTYIFNEGDGEDDITDISNAGESDMEDRIKFGAGITPDSIRLERIGSDLVIHYGEEDKIIVRYAYEFTDGRSFVEYMEFSDGTIWGPDDIASHMGAMYGTEENDTMTGITAMEGYSSNEVFYAGAGDDLVCAYGGDDILYGEEGNDTLYGQEGNDILCGGKGNDKLEGSVGNDTYLFEIGDGEDEINDMSNEGKDDTEDRIKFGEGITPDSIRLERAGDDLVIRYGEGDKIIERYALYYTDGRCFVEYMEFLDGTIWGPDDIASHMGAMYGTEENDTMTGITAMEGYSSNEVFYAGAGDDLVCAYGGDDILYGEEGNDTLYGQEGNDILCGGKGNDTLEGSVGNDTYLFEIGDGEDVITDISNPSDVDTEDHIKFGEGITPDSIRLERIGSDLVIHYGEEDKIIVRYAYEFTDGRSFVEYMEFSDGTIWGPDDIASHMGAMYGTDKNDEMAGITARTGYSGNEVFYAGAGDDIVSAYGGDDILYGEEGNDTLYGLEGNDILCGGKGNDTLEGSVGNDTYLFEIGDGEDVITDISNPSDVDTEDRIKFGEGITPDSIRLERIGNDLVIHYGEEDKIIVRYAYEFMDGRSFVEYMEFPDGTIWDPDDIVI